MARIFHAKRSSVCATVFDDSAMKYLYPRRETKCGGVVLWGIICYKGGGELESGLLGKERSGSRAVEELLGHGHRDSNPSVSSLKQGSG